MKIFRHLKNLLAVLSDWREFVCELPERIYYVEQSHMSLQDSVAKLEAVDEKVAAAVQSLNQQIKVLRDESTGDLSQEDQGILADRIEATIAAIGNALVPPQSTPGEVVAENSEAVGGVLADEAISGDGNELTIGYPIPVADESAAPVAGLNDDTVSVSEENRHSVNPSDQV